MSLTNFSLRNPYAIIAAILIITAMGIMSLLNTPTDLFPDTMPPQVVIITIQPGASSADMTDKITRVIEKELNTLSGLVKVTSTTRDEVSSINLEFNYKTRIADAVQEAQNAISKIASQLPKDALQPRIYKITDTNRPITTLALSPKEGSIQTLYTIRLLADNQITDMLLSLEGVADVDVFGSNRPEIQIRVNPNSLAANSIDLGNVISAISNQNIAAPAGIIYSEDAEYLIKVLGEFKDLSQIRNTPIKLKDKSLLKISDVASVELATETKQSIYHGNGKAAIGINVLRAEDAATVKVIQQLKQFLPELKAAFPDIVFDITDDQQGLIDVNVRGMEQSLLQAIIITVIIIFVFLADVRAATVVAVSIPISFLGSLMVISLSPYTLNMVTLSGLIIAVGMVVDASVVVLENIYRHWQQDGSKNAFDAAISGTKQVSLEISAGMLTTIVVLIPVAFTGGYTQQVMRPLNMVIVTTLVVSLFSAITIVPLMASKLLNENSKKSHPSKKIFSFIDKSIDKLSDFYLFILKLALRHRIKALVIALAAFAVTVRIAVPLVGGELMPPMDTGISMIKFETPVNFSPKQVEQVLERIEKMIYKTTGVEMVSSVVGSEPGKVSFGSGGATAQSGIITINLVDRTRREQTIWQIQDKWREQIKEIEGVSFSTINEYGATPMATTKAPLNIIISGEDSQIVSGLADECLKQLEGLPGLVDVRRSWNFDKTEFAVDVDPSLAKLYGTSPLDVSSQLKTAIKGAQASSMKIENMLDIPIIVQYQENYINSPEDIANIYISTGLGQIPLRAIAEVDSYTRQPFITREMLRNTLDITAVNRVYTIKQVSAMVKTRLSNIQTPYGYNIEVAGSSKDMANTQKSMLKSLVIGIIILYILLMSIFKSFKDPITILSAIPLGLAAAMWGLLIFNKPMCMPAMMGLILLGGTIINNSILMLGFILNARKDGMNKQQAIEQAVKLRIRPILMTTTSTVLGLTPLVLEMAVGLERMSPLGIAAASGLLVGTFLTMVMIPVIYSFLDSFVEFCSKIFVSIKPVY